MHQLGILAVHLHHILTDAGYYTAVGMPGKIRNFSFTHPAAAQPVAEQHVGEHPVAEHPIVADLVVLQLVIAHHVAERLVALAVICRPAG